MNMQTISIDKTIVCTSDEGQSSVPQNSVLGYNV